MAEIAHALARSSLSEVPVRPRDGRRISPRRRQRPNGFKPLMLLLVALAVLVGIGMAAAHALDSRLLGFAFADLVFLIGVAFYGAVASPRS